MIQTHRSLRFNKHTVRRHKGGEAEKVRGIPTQILDYCVQLIQMKSPDIESRNNSMQVGWLHGKGKMERISRTDKLNEIGSNRGRSW